MTNIHLFEQALAETPGLNTLLPHQLPESISMLYGSKQAAGYILQLRLLNWRKWYRGPIKQEGKVISCKFRSDLTVKEEAFLKNNLEELRKLCVTC